MPPLNLFTLQANLLTNWKFQGNEFWRFLLLLLIILLTLAVGRLIRYPITRIAARIEKNPDAILLALFIRCLSAPISVVVFGIGLYIARFCFNFALEPDQLGFSEQTYILWGRVAQAVIAISFAYLMFRLVDIIEHYLKIWTSRTATTLDDMLVPVIRKSLRIFIGVVSILFIADNILDMELGAVIAAAGVGGLAIALAAQDTIANFFGSVNIFADRPFQVNDRIRVDGFDGPVEAVGFR
ncbi:MAG: mechanosensitive ion channel, partial [Planctomycetes bacterium]|nr:mechanosensitive ion channel [Planctomycetota bacterium]